VLAGKLVLRMLKKETMIQLAPHRQPRRDRLPDHPHRGGSDSHGRGLFGCRREARCTCARRTRRVHIGPSPARESYLVGEKIIAAAKATRRRGDPSGLRLPFGEREFAQAVIDAGLVWVGPKPSRSPRWASRTRQEADGRGRRAGHARLSGRGPGPALSAEAAKIGYPVLIKAVAGGGGKGMRRVENAADFADSLARCQREAAARSATTTC
jgi:acetyl/propionyl-CoA carboxylase alpha subunit